MAELFATGRIADLILELIVLEAIVLKAWHARTGRGPPPLVVLSNLAAGAGLVLALRAALIDSPWGWIAFWLVLALIAHLLDLRRRWPA